MLGGYLLSSLSIVNMQLIKTESLQCIRNRETVLCLKGPDRIETHLPSFRKSKKEFQCVTERGSCSGRIKVGGWR